MSLRTAVLALAGAAAFTCAASPPGRAQSTPAPAFVPARSTSHTDALGFSWDLEPRTGMVTSNRRTGPIAEGLVLSVGGQPVRDLKPTMLPDGTEFLLKASVSGLALERRVTVVKPMAAVRYVDSFHNPGSAAITIQPELRVQLNVPAQGFFTESGASGAGGLAKGDGGVVMQTHSGWPAILLSLAAPEGKVKPTVAENMLYEFTFAYSLTVPAGGTVALTYAIAQRAPPAAYDAKTLAELFKPLRSREFRKGVPEGLRGAIVNAVGDGYGDEFGRVAFGMPPELAELRGGRDQLALGEGTRLSGVAAGEGLEGESRFGRWRVALDRVAALIGNRAGRRSRVWLRDGQVLAGRVNAPGLRLDLPAGVSIDLRVETIDRLLLAQRPEDGVVDPAAWGFLETLDGDCLAVKLDPEWRMVLATPWGPREVAVGDLRQAVRGPVPAGGFAELRVTLRDGSRFCALPEDRPWAMTSLLLGPIEVHPAGIRALYSVAAASGPEADQPPAEPRLVLAGGDLLVGRIDLAEVRLETEAGTVAVTPEQVRVLASRREEGAASGRERVPFRAELWDGGVVEGLLVETVLRVRCREWVGHVDAFALVEAVTASPQVPESLQARIEELVRDLGHEEWSRREEASKELAELGPVVRVELERVRQESDDPEVKRRTTALLEKLDR